MSSKVGILSCTQVPGRPVRNAKLLRSGDIVEAGDDRVGMAVHDAVSGVGVGAWWPICWCEIIKTKRSMYSKLSNYSMCYI